MPIGGFDAISVGASRGVMLDLILHCAEQTGGYAVQCTEAERVSIRDYFSATAALMFSAFNDRTPSRSASFTLLNCAAA